MVLDDKKWHYLIVTKLSTLSRGVTTDKENFYCLNCLHSFRVEIKVKQHEKVCKNYDFCDAVMLN